MSFGLVIYIAVLALLTVVIVALIIKVNSKSAPKHVASTSTSGDPYDEPTNTAVKKVFNEDFKEELRNRGILHFEKIISENAMFMQQDLRLITSQMNDYLRQQISAKLEEAFADYTRSINDARELAINSISKTQVVLDKERAELTEQIKKQLEENRRVLMKNFSDHMAEIINHYLMAAIGNQIDLTDQLEFILNDLEANKKAIIEDISDGA